MGWSDWAQVGAGWEFDGAGRTICAVEGSARETGGTVDAVALNYLQQQSCSGGGRGGGAARSASSGG